MTAEQLKLQVRDLMSQVEAATTPEAENALARHLRDLQAFAYRTTHMATKVGTQLGHAANLLERAGDGKEAAKHIRTAVVAMSRMRDKSHSGTQKRRHDSQPRGRK